MSFATIGGVSLRHEWRPGDGVPIVLLHEMGGALESWDLVLRHLSGPALRLDLRGFGLSEKPTGPVTLDDHVGDVIGLIDHLGLDIVRLAGGAVGVAIAVAATLGARCAGLIALAPATGVRDDRKAGVHGLADRLASEGLRGFLEADTIPKAWPEDRFERGEGFDIFLATQLGTAPESLAATYRMLADMDLGPALARLTCPSLFVAGTHDIARTPALVRAVAESVPGARFREIDSGHFMGLQTPELVAALLADS
jgi:pimeloyl-ACP methyl ester carboxylesterase